MLAFLTLLPLALGATLQSGGADQQIPTLEAIERRILDARRAIATGEVKVRLKGRRSTREGKSRPLENRRTIWFAPGKAREDAFTPYDKRQGIDESYFRTIRCVSPNRSVIWTDQILKDHGKAAVSLRDKDNTPEHLGVPDVRALGLVPNTLGSLIRHRMDAVVGMAAPKRASVNRDQLDGSDLLRINYVTQRGAEFRVWVSPDMDYSVLKIETQFSYSNQQYVDTISSTYQRHTKSQLWFPKHYEYARTVNGKIAREETADIEIVSLNEGVNDEIFELKGMDIPPGTYLQFVPQSLNPKKGNVVWNGSEVETQPRLDRRLLREAGKADSSKWKLALGSVILSSLAAVLLLAYFLKSKTRPSSQL